jgi:hypothetical protein
MAPDHPAAGPYGNACESIIGLLQRKIPEYWTTVSMFNVRRMNAEIAPTIVVMVKAGSFANWSNLRLQILMEPGLDGVDVWVEFRIGAPLTVSYGRA